jgi:exopolysaccharide production protein ExoZ
LTDPTTSLPPSAGRRYVALDGLRGLAVLLVFFVHAAGNAASAFLGTNLDSMAFTKLHTGGERLLFWLHRSHHGVFLFFVLSGFLIGKMWWPRQALRYRTFVRRRTLRIYPAFLLAFAASLLFAYGSDNWHPPDWPRVAGNLLFLNGLPDSPVMPFNTVTWSLFYEMAFYLAFPWLLLGAMRIVPGHARWLAAAGIAMPALAVAAGASSLHLSWSLLFFGVAAAMCEERLVSTARRVPTVLVAAAYLAVTTQGLYDLLPAAPAIMAFGVATVLVLGKCCAADNVMATLLSSRPAVWLGRVSYSFYLLHWMIVVLVARWLAPQRDALGALGGTVALFAMGFLLSAIAATVSWWLAERPYFAAMHVRQS